MDLKPSAKRARRATELGDDKNATPDAPSRSSESCLDDVRPLSVGMDRSAQSLSDPATQRESAVAAFGDGSINVTPSKINGYVEICNAIHFCTKNRLGDLARNPFDRDFYVVMHFCTKNRLRDFARSAFDRDFLYQE